MSEDIIDQNTKIARYEKIMQSMISANNDMQLYRDGTDRYRQAEHKFNKAKCAFYDEKCTKLERSEPINKANGDKQEGE